MKPLSPFLEDWNSLSEDWDFTGILLGNGASRNVWDGFGYGSLYKIACDENEHHRLSETDQLLFDRLNTENFEGVLAALATARVVTECCEIRAPILEERYESIRSALAEAVKTHHVPWPLVVTKIRDHVREALRGYSSVYSTNYDLLLYWSVMGGDGRGFRDFFWSGWFDPADVQIWDEQNTTRLLYPHGGLHLCRDSKGKTLKRKAAEGKGLLEQFGETYNGQQVTPLFVAEGTSDEKIASIHRSDYLYFSYSCLVNHAGALCVFGHSLGVEDQHIVRAIGGPKSQIAISIRPGRDSDVRKKKAAYIERLPESSLLFYDATTHPLGSPDLRAQEEPLDDDRSDW